MKRIGFISYDFYPFEGGQGRFFSELVKRLNEKGNSGLDIVALSPNSNTLPYHHLILGCTKWLPGGQLLFSLFLNLQLGQIIRKHKLDRLVINGGPGGVLLLRKPTVPIAYCGNHTYSQQAQYVSGQSWKKLFIPLEKRGYQLADRLFAISTTTVTELKENYGLEESEIDLIPPGIDLDKFSSRDGKAEDGSVLFVGRLDPRKGIATLLSAFAGVVSEFNNAKLYIIGTGRLEDQLREEISREGLNDNVILLGFVSDKELPEWYQRVSLMVVPSVLEGFGITALEGIASGVPIIASRVPGLVDIVDDGRNGYLVASGDREELKKKLLELLKDPQKRENMGKEGRLVAQEKFSWGGIVDKACRFLQSL